MSKTDDKLTEDRNFLFDILKQMKLCYETPVVFLTTKDYSETVFNTLCLIRKHFQNSDKEGRTKMIDCIVDYHLDWLHSVNDIDQFKIRIQTTQLRREEIYQAVSYTIDAMQQRIKHLRDYMDTFSNSLSNLDQVSLNADLEIVDAMHKDVVGKLVETLKYLRNFGDDEEFKAFIVSKSDELLLWMDKIFDGLSMDLSKYVNVDVPQLTADMTKTLQQIVEELHSSRSPSAQKLLEELKEKGKELSTMIRSTATRNLEMSKVIEKISVLEDRISRLENEPTSAAVMALKHKKDYLEKRLASMENLKTTIKELNEKGDIKTGAENETCVCEDFFQLRIFNHLLPLEARERLVTELCYLWDLAVFGEGSRKSIISILSVAENKEEFTDELGTFHVDENGRKIYKLPGDETLYQPNEKNELVPLSDEGDHVYFYDECGRYYVDFKTRERIYKAYASTSEYVMDTAGVLLKLKEEREGITYYYDTFGRYYINDEGKHIYRDEDTASEYENDGLGNLVRIRSHADLLEVCPEDARVSDDFRYLKCVVGAALRKCIGDVILHQPADPVKYLSSCLVKFRENMEFRDIMTSEREDLEAEREAIREAQRLAAERAALEAALLAQGGSEASYDSNLLNYATINEEDDVGVIPASTPRTPRSNV